MSSVIYRENLILPPQVNLQGECFGFLDLVIKDINWVHKEKYPTVQVCFQWWGEKEENESVKINSSNNKTVRYKINTNFNLLRSYLEHCENINAYFVSLKTKKVIGHSKIKIPEQFYNGINTNSASIKTPIISDRKVRIGDISLLLNINMALAHPKCIQIHPRYIDEKRQQAKNLSKNINNNNKENIAVHGVKKSIADHETRSPKLISPRHLKKNEKVKKVTFASKSVHNNLLKISIRSLEFNQDGLTKMRNFFNFLPFNYKKCIIKCAAASKTLKGKTDDSNLITYVFDTPLQKINFRNKDLVYEICQINNDPVFINLGFCITSIEKSTAPLLIGITKLSLDKILETKSSCLKVSSVIDMERRNLKIGNVSINIDFEDSVNETDVTLRSEDVNLRHFVDQQVQTTSHPSTSNDAKNSSENNENTKKTEESSQTSKSSNKSSDTHEDTENNDDRDTEMLDMENKKDQMKSKIYHALIYIESLRNVHEEGMQYFITYEGFWNQCQEMTRVSEDYFFNYLKISPVICDSSFLQRVQNKHLEFKLWEKSKDNSEKCVATCLVSLQQFFIAFKDSEMIEYLSTNKLPVISMDGWCNFISPLSSTLFCQAKMLVALGNEHQIDYLKITRNIPLSDRYTTEIKSPSVSETNMQLKSKLSAFIETLSSKNTETLQSKSTATSHCSMNSSQKPQLRKTSDLLDSLQKALAQPITESDAQNFYNSPLPLPSTPTLSTVAVEPPLISQNKIVGESSQASLINDEIRMLITVEAALNLPKVIIKKGRNKRKNKTSDIDQNSEFDPFVYVTFEASSLRKEYQTSIVKSHEGDVYCTKIIKNCNPQWNESFEVDIEFDILKNPEKKFVIKVWRKGKFENNKQYIPTPFEDAVIGFSAIDLSVLLTGLPHLNGFYNIVDFSGKVNGQIKLSFKPLQNITDKRNPSSPLVPLTCPLNIDIDNDNSSILSRTLKRKFSELDEITRRLKARLFDVTGDDDDDFENDINTVADEEDYENYGNCNADFAWLSTNNLPTTSSSNNLPTHREISGCSSKSLDDHVAETSSPIMIDNLLKKYDLDTIINPNIFKSILDPHVTNSDSTPTLNAQKEEIESADTTISSIVSNDHVHTIQRALQNASLQDPSTSNTSPSTRKDPDGEHENQ